MPTLQQLRYLVSIADLLHFRRAAEECHVTQPTLSAQLKTLEERLGATLVERNRARVILTPTGKEIADRARRILSEVEDIRTIARAEQMPLSSVLRVGVVMSLGSYFLPLVVPDLHRTHPKLGLYVREGTADALIRGLEQGSLDMLLFPLPLTRGDFETRSLFREPIEVVVPQDHRLADETVIDPEMLRGETILSLEPGHRLYEQVSTICRDYGADLSHDFEGTSLDTLRQMVATGIGISLMPALYVKSEVARHDIVVARHFRGTPPSRTIGMVWRKGTSRQSDFEILADQMCQTMKIVAPEVTVLG
ncbi:LysR substrate-binding domain-containing protein [Roseobacteraceae bacterium S113]